MKIITKSEQITEGLCKSFQTADCKMANRVCYGYDMRPDGELIINEAEANVVCWIFDRYLAGDSFGKIATAFEKQGILSPTGKAKWNREAISKLLSNEKYTGSVLLQKTVSICGVQFQNDGQQNQVLVKGHHEAIISVSDFEKAQQMKAGRSKAQSQKCSMNMLYLETLYQKWKYYGIIARKGKGGERMKNRIITLIPAKPVKVPTQDRPFSVAAYCRVSSPSDEQELSMETQIQYYSNAIEKNVFWKSAGIYADTATGRNMKQRGAFKKLLAKCRIGKVDLILTKSISRFGRNSLDTIKVLRELKDNRVDVYFEQENIHLLDPAAQHVIEIYCALAQNESENKSHSIRWGIQAGFQGGTSGYQNFACYGYRFDEGTQGLVIVPEEAEVVRLIFHLRLRGLSYGMIAAELEEKGIPSPTGKPKWNRECIRKMLCNEKYAGAVLLQKTYVEDFFTGKQKKNSGQRQRYYYKNNHEAIVPLEIFKWVQDFAENYSNHVKSG